MPTRERFPIGQRVRVAEGVPKYAGRIGHVTHYSGPEIGVQFHPGQAAVWFRARELAPDAGPAGPPIPADEPAHPGRAGWPTPPTTDRRPA